MRKRCGVRLRDRRRCRTRRFLREDPRPLRPPHPGIQAGDLSGAEDPNVRPSCASSDREKSLFPPEEGRCLQGICRPCVISPKDHEFQGRGGQIRQWVSGQASVPNRGAIGLPTDS